MVLCVKALLRLEKQPRTLALANCMQHRGIMTEIAVVPAPDETPRTAPHQNEQHQKCARTLSSSGYVVRRVLYHHACYPPSTTRKNQRDRAIMFRAVAVTALAVALMLAILWLVSRDDHHYHDGQAANRPQQEQEEEALTRMNPLLALSRFVRMLRDHS
jgi:hypothetical protein